MSDTLCPSLENATYLLADCYATEIKRVFDVDVGDASVMQVRGARVYIIFPDGRECVFLCGSVENAYVARALLLLKIGCELNGR